MGTLSDCLKTLNLSEHESAILRGYAEENKSDTDAAGKAIARRLAESMQERETITQKIVALRGSGAATFKPGDTVSFKGDSRVDTVESVGTDGWVYTLSGGAGPAHLVSHAEPAPDNSGVPTSWGRGYEGTGNTHQENVLRWNKEAAARANQPDATPAPTKSRIDAGQLERDFRTYPVRVLEGIIEQGGSKALFKAAKVKSADAFSDMTTDDQSAAYVAYVKSGGAPIEGLPTDYNAWVKAQERDIENRRMSTETVIRQINGKPFKTEDGARQAQERFDVKTTHKIAPVDGGFELQILSIAAQAENKRIAAGQESYIEAQTAVLAEMGIGEKDNGEIDATDAQWAEIDRRVNARLRGEKTEEAPTVDKPAEAKEPWQMTLSEYEAKYGKPRKGATSYSFNTQHRSAIGTAINQGKPVPPEVLADYPDLAAKATTEAKPASDIQESDSVDYGSDTREVGIAVGRIHAALRNIPNRTNTSLQPVDSNLLEDAFQKARDVGVEIKARAKTNNEFSQVWDISTPGGATYLAYLSPTGRGNWMPVEKGVAKESTEAKPTPAPEADQNVVGDVVHFTSGTYEGNEGIIESISDTGRIVVRSASGTGFGVNADDIGSLKPGAKPETVVPKIRALNGSDTKKAEGLFAAPSEEPNLQNQFTPLEQALAAKAHDAQAEGEVGIATGGGQVRFVSMADAVDAVSQALAAGTRKVPFQISNATGIRLGDVQSVLDQVKTATATPQQAQQAQEKADSSETATQSFDDILDSVLDQEFGVEPAPKPAVVAEDNIGAGETASSVLAKQGISRKGYEDWLVGQGYGSPLWNGGDKENAEHAINYIKMLETDDGGSFKKNVAGIAGALQQKAQRERTATQAAVSAAKNAGSGLANAAKGLNALFATKPGTLGSGPVFNEDTYAQAKPFFQMAIADLQTAATDVKEMVVALVRGLVANGLDRSAIKGMSPYLQRFVEDTLSGKVNYDETTEVENNDPTQQGSTPTVDSRVAEVQPGTESEAASGADADGAGERRADDGNIRGAGGRSTISDNAAGEPEVQGGGRESAGLEYGTPGELARRSGSVSADPDFIPGIGGLTREGSWYETAKRNIDLIELARKIEAEGRAATPQEQEQLSKYVGFGASAIRNPLFPIPQQWAKQQNPSRLIWSDHARDPQWKALGERLEALPIEWQKSVLQSTQYAHYTSEGIVRSVWGAIQRLGFTGGQVFEPGMGIGSFAMLMPESVRQTSRYSGVEFDGPTALIAKLLSPQQNMLHDDFIKRKFPKNFYDVAIGNPPFSQTKIFGDPEYQKQGFMLHDFFFAKSIDSVRPGGLLAFVTSKGTMDKQTDKARKYLAARADLVGAIRLPSTAFEDNAGTSVVTDVIFLRKRAEGEAPGGQAWGKTETIETKDGPVVVNEYFAAHPEMVLGQHRISGNTDDIGRRVNSNGRGGEQYTVVSYDKTPAELDAKFAAAVQLLPANVYSALGQSAESIKKETAKIDFDPSVRREGVVYVAKDGTVMKVEEGVGKSLDSFIKLSDKDKAWLKDYVKLRELIQLARQSQVQDGDWEADLKKINKAYDAFRKTHGPIREFTVRSRKTTDKDGEVKESTWNVYKNKRLYQEDYDQTIVLQLETITEAGEIVKGAFLKGRTIGLPVVRNVRSVGDALAVSLDENGSLDLADIGQRMNLSPAETIEALGNQIYQSMDGTWQLADEYLSGNVVAKLEEAERAARLNPDYERNVEALKAVQPEKLGPSQISAKLGAPWLPVNFVNEFAVEIEAGHVTFDPVTESWQVEGGNLRSARKAGAEYGTAKRSPSELLEAALNSRVIKIVEKGSDGKQVVDQEGTTAANQVMKQIKDKFKSWVWTDSERASALVEAYNHLYNNIAPRVFEGSHLTLPGVSLRFKLHPHQLRAIWRVIQTGNTYLAHSVGSGKTIEMIAAGMEQKRLGLIKKPIYVVPNHMLEQFSNEFMELYPLANIMVADDENFSAERRRAFVAAATMNNPDAVIITHDAFQRIGVKEESVGPIRDEILTDLELELASVAKDNGARVRRGQLEQQIEAVKQRFDRIINADGKDSTLKFEDIGADFVFYDEAHAARKLDFHTAQQIKGIDPNGSMRAMDMYIKTRYLESQRAGRSMVFASGTPVTNTMGELYTIMRFFAPEALDQAGISTFDSWSRMFGEVASALEPNAAGKYELIERFAKFDNVPELMSRVRQFMDVLTSEHLGALVKRPDLIGGKPNLNIVEPTEALTEYMQGELARRIEISKAWKPSKDEPANLDPIVNIISDGRFAAIDPRFFGKELPEGAESIITTMGAKVIANFNATKDNVYVNKEGNPEAIKGGTQMVFYNLGFGGQAHKTRGFNSRAAFTKILTDGGIPRDQIEWFDDANTDAKKEAVFKAMRNGKVRVLIGSAKKMGTGVNVQNRLTHLHYQDPPWFPSDVEQPHGRIIRQGNQNAEVGIEWYTTKGTYQSTMWQMVARKQRFIDQAFSGDKSMRSMDDMGEASLFEQAAAVASGDPRALQLAGLRQDVERLERLQAAHSSEQINARSALNTAEWYAENAEKQITVFSKAFKVIGESHFTFTTGEVDGNTFRKPGEFGTALKAAFNKVAAELEPDAKTPKDRVIAKMGENVSLVMAGVVDKNKFTRAFSLNVVVGDLSLSVLNGEYSLGADIDDVGLSRRVINVINGIDTSLRQNRSTLDTQNNDMRRLKKKLGAPFEYQQELAEKYGELKSLESQLAEEGKAKPPVAPVVVTANGAVLGDNAAPDSTKFSKRTTPRFYSPLANAFEKAKQVSMPANQWALWLGSNKSQLGLKDDEINFTGILDYLELRGKDKVTKAEIADFLAGNGVVVNTVEKGPVYDEVTPEGLFDEKWPNEYGDWLYSSIQEAIANAWEDQSHEVWQHLKKSKDQYIEEATDDDGEVDIDAAKSEYEDDVERLNADDHFTDDEWNNLREEAQGLSLQENQEEADQINEEMLRLADDNTKFSGYWESSYKGGIPGSYRETLVTLPEKTTADDARAEYEAWARSRGYSPNASFTEDKYLSETGKSAPAPRTMSEMESDRARNFKGGHWDELNVLAHIRTDEVLGSDGKRYLRVGELQSDFGQSYKKQKDAIRKSVDSDFQGIVKRMKDAGVLEVICD